MKKQSTKFPDVWIIKPDIFPDERGFFLESYSYKKFVEIGISTHFIQDNHSRSSKGTLRGLHYQLPPGQEKLIRCTYGTIWDVVVDIRSNSSTFKQWFAIELTENNKNMIYIPVGYAHGFCVLSEFAEVQYKVSNYYDPSLEAGIAWDDDELGIPWPVKYPILSDRDKINPSLSDAELW